MDKVKYLILGASSDLGISFIKSLEQKPGKHFVIAQYFSSEELLIECNNICNVEIERVCVDLSQEKQVDSFVEYVRNQWDYIDVILSFAASKLQIKKFKQFDWNIVKKDLEIQIHSNAKIMKTFLPIMAKRKQGKVIFLISSCTLGRAPQFMTEYTIVKYALLGLMKSLASEYAGKGICINAISPNMIQTKFLNSLDSRMIELLAENSVLKRHIKKEEVVHAIHFLISEQANCINGVNMDLTGGEKI